MKYLIDILLGIAMLVVGLIAFFAIAIFLGGLIAGAMAWLVA